VIFQERLSKVLKCYNFLRVQRRHNCSPASSFANCVMTLYLLKVHLQTFLSIPVTQKCQILRCDTLVANEQYILPPPHGAIALSGAGPPRHRRFTITLRHTIIGRNPLDERSARSKALSVTAQHRYPCPGGIRTRNPSERPQNHALDRAATGIYKVDIGL